MERTDTVRVLSAARVSAWRGMRRLGFATSAFRPHTIYDPTARPEAAPRENMQRDAAIPSALTSARGGWRRPRNSVTPPSNVFGVEKIRGWR
jgi:hypothetical protein